MTISLSRPCPQPAVTSIRQLLRIETDETHQRLHHHDGFARLAAGTISRADYRKLLARLLGFHRPFEQALSSTPGRSILLHEDLLALDVDAKRIAALPDCPAIPLLTTNARRLGARYVIEGSVLGGRQLARRLDHLLSAGQEQGRQFLASTELPSGNSWQIYLNDLTSAPTDRTTQIEITAAACEIFTIFEQWLAGWRASAHE